MFSVFALLSGAAGLPVYLFDALDGVTDDHPKIRYKIAPSHHLRVQQVAPQLRPTLFHYLLQAVCLALLD